MTGKPTLKTGKSKIESLYDIFLTMLWQNKILMARTSQSFKKSIGCFL